MFISILFRFHKIVWGPLKDTESGVIIGGGENGSIHVYSADKLLAGSTNSLTTQLTRHTGAVKALDLNPFQVQTLNLVFCYRPRFSWRRCPIFLCMSLTIFLFFFPVKFTCIWCWRFRNIYLGPFENRESNDTWSEITGITSLFMNFCPLPLTEVVT